ncbi:MAG: hypothetical protein JRG97_05825 [Deltaproteobacteria bacterium]|nr:hypothetical protein [Deltaproteobacteria bacterium]MBW2051466.1 hypothetical protein [Deltaproteobacteria bacterium]MBW2140576.1 hypothetical protein [Deltaproteobacteria bacterium]MBW2323260.1 hypothetical protein [Deltaproteobacteria bacterium]
MSDIEAKKALEEFLAAFNAQDQEGAIAKLHFPFFWIINNRVIFVPEPSKFRVPSKELAESEGWHRSEFDFMEVVHASEEKVHIKLAYSRYKADGTRYATHQGLWIVIKKDGRWGLTCQSNFM